MWGSVNVPGGSTQGADGKSAYQIAVANGFSGTEAEWLASLKASGLPAGGTAGQVPVKVDETDFNAQWKMLKPSDIGALPKENPNFTGIMKGGKCFNVGGAYTCHGNAFGYDAFSDGGFVAGDDSSVFGRYTGVRVYSSTIEEVGSYSYVMTLKVTGADSSFWRYLGDLSGSVAVALYGYRTSYNRMEFRSVNNFLSSFDKDTSTIVVRSNVEMTDIKFFCFLRAAGSQYSGRIDCVNLGSENLVFTYDSTAGTSMAIGCNNCVIGRGSICIGSNLYVASNEQYMGRIFLGTNNKISTPGTGDIVVVGGGDNHASRANCFRVTKTGVFANGNYNSTGADYAEQFEWQDKNPNGDDRIGRFVTLDGEKIRLATPEDDFILGIISGNPSVVGDSYDDQWQGMYATDIFGRFIWEDVTVPAEYDEDGNLISEEHTETCLKINPKYDASEEYIPRSKRKEWATVGMMGKLTVIDDGSCEVNGWCTAGEGGIAVKSEVRTRYRVMSRLDENHVRVLIL